MHKLSDLCIVLLYVQKSCKVLIHSILFVFFAVQLRKNVAYVNFLLYLCKKMNKTDI